MNLFKEILVGELGGSVRLNVWVAERMKKRVEHRGERMKKIRREGKEKIEVVLKSGKERS